MLRAFAPPMATTTTPTSKRQHGRSKWSHNGSMPNIQIKDVPEDTHAVLRQRAAAAHQSLQEYLRSKLIAEAAGPTVDEVLARAGQRLGGSLTLHDAVSALRFDRARR